MVILLIGLIKACKAVSTKTVCIMKLTNSLVVRFGSCNFFRKSSECGAQYLCKVFSWLVETEQRVNKTRPFSNNISGSGPVSVTVASHSSMNSTHQSSQVPLYSSCISSVLHQLSWLPVSTEQVCVCQLVY